MTEVPGAGLRWAPYCNGGCPAPAYQTTGRAESERIRWVLSAVPDATEGRYV